ncbi:MAG: DUF2267 domain-containing protein [Candidatus Omnitrophica bacterium]|nr:DUF2267 domain-containing protein [Candidatus Omnitrophota bacterium]
MTTAVHNLDHALNTAKQWLKDIQQELHYEDQTQVYRAVRAVLQSLRDRLPVNEAADLGSELPLVLAGVYYSGWHPANKPEKMESKEEFYNHVKQGLGNPELDPKHVTDGVLKAISKKISSGEMKDIRSNFPEKLLSIFPQN